MSNSIPPSDDPNNKMPPLPPEDGKNFPDFPGFNPTDETSSSDSSQLSAGERFFPGMPMSKAEFKKFMSTLLHTISTQIKQEQDKMKEVNEKLKRSEEGQD